MDQKIVLATGNPGKARELDSLLAPYSINIVPQSDFSTPSAIEDGLTFVENAIIKARNAATHTGLPAIADDSGLEVDALAGAPGIYSARYAGTNATDQENTEKLLFDLRDIDAPMRSARFQCVIVYLRHRLDPTPLICQGTWEGQILNSALGENGFGYDPVFYVPTHHCSAAQLDCIEKNRISHRGQSLSALLLKLGKSR